MSTSKFIVIEGGEGAGKGTQLKQIKGKLGDTILTTREPGGSEYAEEIRHIILKSPHAGGADPKTLFSLFWAARRDHLTRKILPALESGKHVISDRFDASTFAYQIYGEKAHQLADFFWPTRDFYVDVRKPDLYIYLDVEVKTGLARKTGQGPEEINHFEERALEFHTRMREGYLEFFKHVPHKIIDANQSTEKVQEDLCKVLTEFGIKV